MSDHQSFEHRSLLVEAYDELVRERSMDREQYHLNFMFNPLPGSRSTKKNIMRREVERVHRKLSYHIARRPNGAAEMRLRPIFIGSHDLPVYKRSKTARVHHPTINDGLHFNVIALVPPPQLSGWPRFIEKEFFGRATSRLSVPLDQHFREEQHRYCSEFLYRIRVTPITYGTMTDYTLKTFKHGRVDDSSLLVL